MSVNIMVGDCREVLKGIASESVNCIVTSPPYFGLRDYGVDDQIGLEQSPEAFVAELVDVFREAGRVLRDDGTLWLNLGDTYAGGGNGGGGSFASERANWRVVPPRSGQRQKVNGLKSKDLVGIPWRVAFALQADGWYLRQDIVWSKPNPMPESVTDRCTKAHEYIFLLTKSSKYHYDAEAITEPVSENTHARLAQNVAAQRGSDRVPGKTNGPMKAVGRKVAPTGEGIKSNGSFYAATAGHVERRNKRSVWEVATQPYRGAHFATFPPDLVEPCIKAGCPIGGTVLDPFGGAGTTGLVADRLNRNAILIELNPAYAELARNRISDDAGMFGAVA